MNAPAIEIKDIEVRPKDRRSRTRSHRPDSNSRVYVWIENESVLDNFQNRWSRPVAVYRLAIPSALKALNVPATTKARWNQRAGCPCGCSPAFVLDVAAGHDVDVTIVIEEAK